MLIVMLPYEHAMLKNVSHRVYPVKQPPLVALLEGLGQQKYHLLFFLTFHHSVDRAPTLQVTLHGLFRHPLHARGHGGRLRDQRTTTPATEMKHGRVT